MGSWHGFCSTKFSTSCTWDRQEKSKSVDVDCYPWEAAGEPVKKASTVSTPGISGNEGAKATPATTASASPCEPVVNKATIIGGTKDLGEVTRPAASERKVSISVSPWEEVVEEESETVPTVKETTKNMITAIVPIDKPRRRS